MKTTLNHLNPSQLLPASEVPWPHPASHDLNDWAFENASEVFEAVRYLAVSQYDLFLSLWHHAGRPIDGFESALWNEDGETQTIYVEGKPVIV